MRNALSAEQLCRVEQAVDRVMQADMNVGADHDAGRYRGLHCVGHDEAFPQLLTQSTTVPLVVQLASPNLQLYNQHLT